ncbi:hypothetical protein D3C86_1805530 [compost metagenome]
MLYFQLLFNFVGYYINSFYSGKMIGYSIPEQMADAAPIIGNSALAGVICYLLDEYGLKPLFLFNLSRILIDGAFFLIVYLAGSSLFRLAAIRDFKQFILKR